MIPSRDPNREVPVKPFTKSVISPPAIVMTVHSCVQGPEPSTIARPHCAAQPNEEPTSLTGSFDGDGEEAGDLLGDGVP
jgi:hypothetical protein